MQNIDRILVGLDGDTCADAAAIAALHFSRATNTRLEFVHGVPDLEEHTWFLGREKLAALRAEAEALARKRCVSRLRRLLTPFATTDAEIDEALHVEIGRPSTLLSKRARDAAGSIVVLGSHRSRGVFDFGGTAREMLSAPPGPLWFQGSQPWHEVKRILVPVDRSPSSRDVLGLAHGIAEPLGASVTLMHCIEPLRIDDVEDAALGELNAEMRERAEAEFPREFAAGDEQLDITFTSGEPSDAVHAMSDDFDLVIMGTHGHSAFSRAILGSVAYRVLQKCAKPVVIVPQPAVQAIGTI